MSEESADRERRSEDAATLQRDGHRRLSLEDRFRQNDSIARFRTEVLRARRQGS